MVFRLDTKVAIVTGASRGIGAAMAIGLADAGARVLLVSRGKPNADVVEALEKTDQHYAHFAAGLSQMSSIEPVVKAAMDTFGRIDVLINNAGVILRAPFLEHTEADWDAVMNLNLKLPVCLAQACARQMVKQGEGGRLSIFARY